MEKWFKTLTTQEIKTWLKNFDQPNSLNSYFLGSTNPKDIKAAKAELNRRGMF
tara:strand:- start:1243 stop:1401 length:159 start_codon:yes stop_codon:yes gene_type:complete